MVARQEQGQDRRRSRPRIDEDLGEPGKSGRYKLFHVGDTVKQTGTVRPNHAGSSLKFIAQQHVSGGWRTIATANFRIKSTGSVTAFLTAPEASFGPESICR